MGGPDDYNFMLPEPQIETDEVSKIKAQLKELREQLQAKEDENQSDQEVTKIRTQWRNVGLVLDRVFLIVYFVAILTSSIVLYPRPTN